ncbi:alpha-(1,3)-fucosyltransferase C-like [Amyelois transitella]|uniref:alpha-(1,3)-fucosyltransferase C-like n=1 Tax=Amyelois transitella TaxID=680683 RepID=UPI00067AEE68|nr:alpha-(1,3)-fucosyltransferase C-like [Amyelois transitella]
MKLQSHPKFIKIFYYFLFNAAVFVLLYQTFARHNIKPQYATVINELVQRNQQHRKLKYILLWTHPEDTPFVYFGHGTSVFENKSCEFANCFVTGDRNFLGDYTKFDVIAFSSSRLSDISQATDIPPKRSANQKYVFASVESAAYYPICTDEWNDFFNWTWTYKLNSDAMWGYINVRNATGHSIGPMTEMHWINSRHMDNIDDNLRSTLRFKNRIAAWFVSNCETQSLREEFVKQVNFELNQYNISVDIFGSCGNHYCSKKIMRRCLKLLEKNYFFYFAFENSFSEDYVTEKLMYALQHNTVPVVYGGANYTRFLPKGSYLNARTMGPTNLAHKMFELMTDLNAYAQYFKWKKYYSYHYRHESPDTDDYCKFCAMLNDEELFKRKSYYANMRIWWSDKHTCTMKISKK